MRELTGWHIAHLILIASWGGLAFGEVALELAARREPGLRDAVARLHRLIDWSIEVPLILGILVTGGVLLLRTAPDPILWVKVAAGLGAAASIFVTVWLVTRRARAVREGRPPEEAARDSRRILRVAYVATPLFATALFLGGRRVGWW